MAVVKKLRRSAAPYYGAAAAWVVWAAFLDLYRARDFLLAAGVSLGVFLLLRSVCKDEEVEVRVPDPPKEEEKPTGNAELDKLLSDGAKALAELRRLDGAIADGKISGDIRRLEDLCGKILQQAREDPGKLPRLRQFSDYYLPTALKLLNAYGRMDAAGVNGENVAGTKERVAGAAGALVAAFEKQLDGLYGEEALDISTDVAVLESMLAREGLAGERLEPATLKNADGTDLKLEL